MITFHLVTSTYPPDRGGMEMSALRLTQTLRSLASSRVRVYVRSTSQVDRGEPTRDADDGVYYLSPKRHSLLASSPLGISDVAAKYRVDYLLVRSAIADAIDERPNDRHIIVSFFVSSSGFVAQQVADSLAIPHIASVRGSDFSADFFNPHRIFAIRHVAERASYVVTSNREQERMFKVVCGRNDRIRTIHNALAGDRRRSWTGPHTGRSSVALFSDAGFSFGKGTSILIDSVTALLSAGVDCHLTVVGATESGARDYWRDVRLEALRRFPAGFDFDDYIADEADLADRLLQSDIYCSATLGEGCSNARLRALVYGIPIVSTKCGELADLAGGARHVWLAAPGEAEGFHDLLSNAICEIQNDTVVIDQRLEEWRTYTDPARERREWEVVVNRVAPKYDSVAPVRQKRILFFVHDGTGLGHLRRVAQIAEALQGPCAALIVTGLREAAWLVPPQSEYVHLPSLDSLMPQKSRYWGLKPFLETTQEDALALRRTLIEATIESFRPDAMFLDFLPLGKHDEMLWAVEHYPCLKYFILRGVLDHPENVRYDILGGRGEAALELHYNRVFVTADQRICDVATEYELSAAIATKISYTGYVVRPVGSDTIARVRAERRITDSRKWVVCSAGGGKLGEQLIKECERLARGHPDLVFDIVVGPRSSTPWSQLASEVTEEGNVRYMRHTRYLPLLHASADAVICSGGYNSMLETLQGNGVVISAPVQLRTNDEQYIHAERLAKFAPVLTVTDHTRLSETLVTALNGRVSASSFPLDCGGADAIRRIVLNDLA